MKLRSFWLGLLLAYPTLAGASPFLNYLPSPVDVTPASAGSWQDVDVSALVPPGATGVLILYTNPTASTYSYGVRNKGSLDPFQVDAAKDGQQSFLMTGLDANRTFQVYTGNTAVETHLYAYTMGGAYFFTDPLDRSPTATGWQDVDISADTVGATAIGGIFTVINTSGNGRQFGLRMKGSSDNRVTDIRADTMTLGLVGLDALERAEINVSGLEVDLHLVGVVMHGARFFTNAVNKSTSTQDVYEDVDITGDLLGGDDANGALLEINPSNSRRLTAVRMKGSTEDLYQEMSHGFGSVGIDDSDLFEQKIDFDDMELFLVGYSLSSGGCCELVVTEPTDAIRIVGAGKFDMTFHRDAGGGIEELYDLEEDPGKANDLVGAVAVNANSLALHNIGMFVGTNYNAGATPGARLELLEATPTRVRVRQETPYTNNTGTILKGVRARGDHTIYPSSRIALRWTRSVTFPVTYTTEYVEQFQHYTSSTPPLDQWQIFGELTGGAPGPPGQDDFLLASIETAGATMDFLHILDQPWAAADTTNWGFNTSGQRVNPGWVETTGATLDPGAGVIVDSWDLLTTFDSKTLVDHTSAEALALRDDYQGPDDIDVLMGSPWLHASENTAGGGDDFNEAEGAYVAEFDATTGLVLEIDGSAAVPRHDPFFKLREYHSLLDPPSVTLEGVPLVNDAHYKADVKPVSRAHWSGNLILHTGLQSTGDVDSTPDVGSPGTVQPGVGFVPAKYGNGAQFLAANQAIDWPLAAQSGDLVLSAGAVELWYRPAYDHTDATAHRLWGYSVDASNFFFLQHDASGDLRFVNENGGVPTAVRVPAANYRWHVGDWVHIRATWDQSAGSNWLRIYLDGEEPANVDSGGPYTSVGLPTSGLMRIGSDSTGARPANGIIDELRVYSNAGAPQLLAQGGLASSPREFLSSPSRNFTLSFDPRDGQSRGEYFYLGSDSQFRGLNVSLATPGTTSDAQLAWQFWNGTGWVDLPSVSDGTGQLTRTGTIFWDEPTGWALYSINGETDLYYARAYLESGTYGTKPVENVIKTDILLFQYCGDITLPAQTFTFGAPVATAVTLSSFDASGTDGVIELRWSTASELDNLGFHLYRAIALPPDGAFVALTPRPVPGLGSSPVGASYRFVDDDVLVGTTYYYELEDIDTSGVTTRHGPVAAVAVAPEGHDGDGDEPSPARITYGEPEKNHFRRRERARGDGAGVVLELELVTRGFYAEPVEDGSVRLIVPGLEEPPGATAAIPNKRLWTGKARLGAVRERDVRRFSGLWPSEASAPELVAEQDGTVRATLRRGKNAARPRSTAGLPARVLKDAIQGEEAKSLIELSPLRLDPASGEIVLVEHLFVRLELDPYTRPSRRRGAKRDRTSDAPAPVFLVTREAGLHAVPLRELSRRRVRGLRLSRLGEDRPYHVQNGILYFWSEGPDANPFGREATFQVDAGVWGTRMETLEAGPSPASPASRLYRHSELREEDRTYLASLVDHRDPWFWELLFAPTFSSYDFVAEDFPTEGASARLEVTLHGASDLGATNEHHVRIGVNGQVVGELSWEGKTEAVFETELLDGTLVEGTNTVAIESLGDSAPYSLVAMDRFEVSYLRLARGAPQGEWTAPGTAEIAETGGRAFVLGLELELEGSTSVPRWLQGYTIDPSETLRFEVAAPGRYVVATAPLRPELRRSRAPSDLVTDTDGADWVLVGPEALLPAAAPLLEKRQSEGLVVESVSVEAIYDAFGHGEATPEAIRAYLAHAFRNWIRPPRYVLLLGDASYDFEDNLGTGMPNHVPPYPVRTSYMWTGSDARFAAVLGDDALPDLAIGRLPAANLDDVQRMVAKILRYESESELSHELEALLVADDPDDAGNFEHHVTELSQTVLTGVPTKRVFLREMGPAGVNAEVVAGFDRGASLLSYVGHGGILQWAAENVFDVEDVAALAPQDRPGLVFTMNCLNGYFIFPFLDSLSEALVKAEGRGAVAAFSPSGLSLDGPAHQYHRLLLDEVVHGGHERLGDAILRAQGRFVDEGATEEMLAIYHLFGDPALRLPHR